MAKYLVQGSYTAEGVKGLLKEKASGRRNAVKKALASAGGKLDSMYYSFGSHDVVLVCDFPDNIAAASVSLAVAASGMVRIQTTTLLTVEETDAAIEKTVSYRAPGS
jgi:uncharacterized protein with GYD domain